MPTVVIGNNTGDDYSGTEDAMILEWGSLATRNCGGRVNTEISKAASGDYANTLIKFSGLSNLPASISVSASALYMTCWTHTAGTRTATAKRLLRNWIEGTLDNADRTGDSPASCCWNEYGSQNAWTTAGALSDGNDRSSTASATMTMDGTGYKYFSGSQLNTDIANMRSGTYSNYGWMLERTDGSGDSTHDVFAMSEDMDGHRPYLSVTYTEGGSSGNSYYYQQQQM
jgi:hypothetical protein